MELRPAVRLLLRLATEREVVSSEGRYIVRLDGGAELTSLRAGERTIIIVHFAMPTRSAAARSG